MPSAVDHAPGRPDQPEKKNSPRPSRRDLLAWSAATGGMFLASGALRVLASATARPDDLSAQSPFKLETIPKTLDGWGYVEGSETFLDKLTTRITGSTDHIIRNYYDERTGTMLSVLILYGPAEPVLPHTPQVCYPSSGYRTLAAPVDRTIQVAPDLSAVFRMGLFAKAGGRSVLRQSVYHSYRLDGVWSPTVGDLSLPRRRAGLFKVQVQRRVLEGERVDGDEPIESFLGQLLPTLERMVAESSRPHTTSAGDERALPAPAPRP